MTSTKKHPTDGNGGALNNIRLPDDNECVDSQTASATQDRLPYTREQFDVAIYASLTRVLLFHAPVQNRLPVLAMMARMAADELVERREQYLADLLEVARDTGLIDLLGTVTVKDALATAFESVEWGRS